MMTNAQRTSALVAAAVTALALALVVDRGGLIAWSALLLGAGLLLKIWRRPGSADLKLSVGLGAGAALAWIGTLGYVLSTWESGEVVELAMETRSGAHTARVWVLDIDAHEVIYYDASAEAAESLLAGNPLKLTRGGHVSTRIPEATKADDLPEERANRIFEAMASKYGARVDAATLWYLMLGRSGDRVAVVASLSSV